MKKIIMILLLIGIANIACQSQINPYGSYSDGKSDLSFSIYGKECEIIPEAEALSEDILISEDTGFQGNVEIIDNYIYCTDTTSKEEYVLKILSEEKLLVMCLGDYYKSGDTLYVSVKYSKYKPNEKQKLIYYGGIWKNGKKEGIWTYYIDSKTIKEIKYSEGIILSEKKIIR
jgi:hypothetical protein